MRVVITGASGNVGTALARRLRAGGHEVVGIARRPPAPGAGDGPQEWVRADLSRECHDVLVEAFRGADAVVHLVWGFQPSHRIDYLEEVGVGGTRRVLDAVAAAGVGQLLHQSSIGAYSPRLDDRPVAEDWPTGGIQASPYSRHKAAAERLLDDFEASTATWWSPAPGPGSSASAAPAAPSCATSCPPWSRPGCCATCRCCRWTGG